MDKLDRYRQIILNIITEYTAHRSSYPELETFPVIDRERDHYQVLRDGWRNHRRFYGCVMHFDIKDGKVWVRHDGTELALADRLVEQGIPKQDIVMAFHPPVMRKFTDYAHA